MHPPPPTPHRPLPAGYVLDDYRVERVLGRPGGFGVTYAAIDLPSGQRVALKELFPSDYVMRDGTGQVVVQTLRDQAVFEQAVKMFRKEADILSKVRHENVVRVLDYMEANGTAYMVMAYEDGYDLAHHLLEQQPQRPNQNELTRLLMPVLDGLEAVHNLDYLHCDIKPSNIYLTRRHAPLLLDFGAARQIVTSRSRRVDQILTPPFGPIEQYGTISRQGPYTDIYALGVVMVRAILYAEAFPDAPHRVERDTFAPLLLRLSGQEYSDRFLSAVDWALRVDSKDRPPNIAAWRKAFEEPSARPKPPPPPPPPEPPKVVTTLPPNNSEEALKFWRTLALTACAVAGVVAFIVIVYWLLNV